MKSLDFEQYALGNHITESDGNHGDTESSGSHSTTREKSEESGNKHNLDGNSQDIDSQESNEESEDEEAKILKELDADLPAPYRKLSQHDIMALRYIEDQYKAPITKTDRTLKKQNHEINDPIMLEDCASSAWEKYKNDPSKWPIDEVSESDHKPWTFLVSENEKGFLRFNDFLNASDSLESCFSDEYAWKPTGRNPIVSLGRFGLGLIGGTGLINFTLDSSSAESAFMNYSKITLLISTLVVLLFL